MTVDMRQALTERRELIEARAEAVLAEALDNGDTWVATLGAPPIDRRAAADWRRQAQTVAAYRDRYAITGPTPLGAMPENTAQKIDAARARAALARAEDISRNPEPDNIRRPVREATGPSF